MPTVCFKGAIVLVATLFLLLLTSFDVRAEDPKVDATQNVSSEEVQKKEPGGPVAITSDRMVLKNLENKIFFEGNVSIKREALTILADYAEVLLSSAPEGTSGLPGESEGRSISKITTSGHVRVTRGRQQATAEKGVYKRGTEVIVLTGNPEVWDKDFRVKGKEISFFIDEERTLITESQAVIHKGTKGLSSATSPN